MAWLYYFPLEKPAHSRLWEVLHEAASKNCEPKFSYYVSSLFFSPTTSLLHRMLSTTDKSPDGKKKGSLILESWLRALPICHLRDTLTPSHDTLQNKILKPAHSKIIPLFPLSLTHTQTHTHIRNRRWLAIECCANGVTNDLSLAPQY